ncbi:MAG: lipoxygenase family protein [Planctomycetota bacterium]
MRTHNLTITVRTGSDLNAGTDGTISVQFTGTHGESGPHDLTAPEGEATRDTFEAGGIDTFQLRVPDLGELLYLTVANRGRAKFDDWYLNDVTVTVDGRTWEFPHYNWVLRGATHTVFESTAVLPQKVATETQRSARLAELERRRQRYQWVRQPGVPGSAKLIDNKLPFQEVNSCVREQDLNRANRIAARDLRVAGLLGQGQTLNSLDALEELFTTIDAPSVSKRWRDDAEYGRQLLAGVAPNNLFGVDTLPAKFPVTEDSVAGLLEGRTLQSALAEGRMFMVDYEVIDGLPAYETDDERRYCTAGMGLFYRSDAKELLPVAIQLGQDPKQCPLFTPHDTALDWLAAKIYLKNAEANLHQMVTHALNTHLSIEPFVIATMRQLSSQHPIWKLMRRHLRSTVSINSSARTVLINPGGVFDQFVSLGGPAQGHLQLAARCYARWKLSDNALPNDLAARRVHDVERLPDYPYRDDCLPLWNAISNYIHGVLSVYYKEPGDILEDFELQAWAKDLCTNGHDPAKIPGGGRIETRAQLHEILTTVMYSASVLHAAVNFQQFDHYGWMPNAPLAVRRAPPAEKGLLREEDFVELLPSIEQTAQQMAIGVSLTAFTDDEEYLLPDPTTGYRERYFRDAETEAHTAAFHRELLEAAVGIEARNRRRAIPYRYVLPYRVPASTAI